MIDKYKLYTIILQICLLTTMLILAGVLGMSDFDLGLLALTLLLLNYESPLVLRNYFVMYTALLFFVGSGFYFPEKNYLKYDGLLFLLFFFLGYGSGRFIYNRSRIFKKIELKVNAPSFSKSKLKFNLLVKLLFIFLFCRILLLGLDIFQTGFSAFYQGQSLVDKISNHNEQSFSKGLIDGLNALITTCHYVVAIRYFIICLQLKFKINYWHLMSCFLLIPILSLSRSSFAFGAINMALFYSISLGNSGHITKKMAAVLGISFFLLIFVSSFIGGLRYAKSTDLNSVDLEVLNSMTGELTPIIMYNDLKNNIDNLEYQYGGTIIPPLIFKFIPRSWYPNKPVNSTAYYAMRYDQINFEAGLMFPTTIYGDLFLNFGKYVSLMLFSVFGIFVSYLDTIYTKLRSNKYHIFIIFHLGFYGLLRNNLPEGLFSILYMVAMFYFLDASLNTVLRKMNVTANV